MGTLLIALGIAAVAYGVTVMLVWSGTTFFAVWYAIGAVLAGWGLLVRCGAWARVPALPRHAVEVVACLALALFVGVGALVMANAATPAPAGLDRIVVLGAQVRADGTPSQVLRYRLDTAADYLLAHEGATVTVCGGQGPNEPVTEAACMAGYLESRGVSRDRITLEDRSATTVENVRNAAVLLGSEGLREGEAVGIVTNDFHVFRATRLARRQGLPGAEGVAAPSDAWYLPNNLLREVMGVLKDTLVGNM